MNQIQIVMALVWLSCGVLVMRYANQWSHKQTNDTKREQAQKTFGTWMSFYSLLLFVNAALSVYLSDVRMVLMVTIGSALIGALVLLIGYQRVLR